MNQTPPRFKKQTRNKKTQQSGEKENKAYMNYEERRHPIKVNDVFRCPWGLQRYLRIATCRCDRWRLAFGWP